MLVAIRVVSENGLRIYRSLFNGTLLRLRILDVEIERYER